MLSFYHAVIPIPRELVALYVSVALTDALRRYQRQKSLCFVYWKRGYWSINHPKEERQAAYKKHIGKKKAQQYIAIVDDDELWAKIGVGDPSVYMAHAGQGKEEGSVS